MAIDLNKMEIEIFRAGNYPQGKYTAQDIKDIAENYDPAVHEAPLILTHEGNQAFGWVDKLRAQGDVLVAKLKQVPEEVNAWIESGKWKKRSAEIYDNFLGTGKRALRAVALVVNPQVKGLKPAFAEPPIVRFSDKIGSFDQFAFEIDLNKDFTASKEGQGHEDDPEHGKKIATNKQEGGDSMTPEEIKKLKDEMSASFEEKIKTSNATLTANFEEKVKALETKNKALEEENKTNLAKFSEAQNIAIRGEIDRFCEDLKKAMKLPPALERKGLKALMFKLAEVPGVMKFKEIGEDKKEVEVEKSTLAVFKEILSALPALVKKGEQFDEKGERKAVNVDVGEFEDIGHEIDEDSVKLQEKAQEIIAAGKKDGSVISFADACVLAERQLKGGE